MIYKPLKLIKMKTKILTLIVLLGIATGNIYAQGFVWAEGFGTEGDDVVMAHKTDMDGNHYMTGYFSGAEIAFGDITLSNSNGSNFLPDLFLVKFDAEWNTLWAYSPDDDQEAYGDIYNPIDIDVDESGNCYLSGSFRIPQITFGEITLENVSEEGEYDPFIAKFSTDGTIVWANSFGGEYRDKGRCVAVGPTGDYVYTAGWFYSETIEIGGLLFSNNDNSTNTCDVFLVKYSTAGDFIWATTAGGDNIDRYQDITINYSGEILLAGTFKGHDIDFDGDVLGNTNPFFDDGFVVKYSSVGEVLMNKNAGGMLDDIISSVETDPIGNYYLAGTFLSSHFSLEGNSVNNCVQSGEPTYDVFVAKYNNDDELIWLKRAGGYGNDAINDIALDANNNIYVTGGFTGEEFYFDNNVLTNGGFDQTSDILLVKLNPYGNVEWAESGGGIDNDAGLNIMAGENGEAIVNGQINSDASFGSLYLENNGGMDIFITKTLHNGNVISGTVFYDVNNNGMQDNDENGIGGMVGVIQPGEIHFLSDTNGIYSVFIEPGNYTIYLYAPEFYDITPEYHTASFISFGESDDDNLFGLHTDVDTIAFLTTFSYNPHIRKGQTVIDNITIRNIGTNESSYAIRMINESYQNYFFNNSSPAPYDINNEGDTAYWYFDEIKPFEEKNIGISMTLDTILNKSSLGSIIGVNFAGGQVFAIPPIPPWLWAVIITIVYDMLKEIWKALDPNDITVSPSDSLFFTPDQLAAREPLEYTIRFQNTGNDTCFKTVVLDTLDQNLDLSTFEMLASSHDYDLSINNRTLKFAFNNILLPDSTTNEPESHGYIKYRIRPREDLVIGDSIPNRAYIYFDYEPPVITNTVCTKIGEALGVDENEEETLPGKVEGKVNIYPNPFDKTATILIPDEINEDVVFEIYDISGRKVKMIDVGRSKKILINRDSMNTGMYIYMLKNMKKEVMDRGKMIIN